ncbi:MULTISPECIES: YscO family type III secretion system apparatus protein [unclassified Pseudomonas]|uniref:type III secretion system stalk subunit SctO n=1 Tax=unclassified Pseudomonas TaxID=196821 RepID=UPI0011EE48BE|nr:MULTISPECIES: YscO family type III secretion system apparatus protein [unclassified Pseudomonas]KAA0947067.1 type III secretion protein [Pseudomonas sp. ANT_H4]KAA0953608.1 type III secretion protein [Pseudomonas sp. ANT_H14]
MFPFEIDTLRRLRRHRADRAERALREAKGAHKALLAKVEQAQEALEQTRLEETRQTAELANQRQGQVVSLQDLKAWGAQERKLSAGTARDEGQLQALYQQQERQVAHINTAQKQVTQCLREVEKLQELAVLLAEETP